MKVFDLQEKVKAKGVGPTVDTEEVASDAPADQQGQQTNVQPTFKLDRATLKVFTVFFTPGLSGGTPGEIPWVNFLRAMATSDFGVQKLWSSH